MNAIGLKYVGNREEGIMVMLFRSYKTAKVTKNHPYRFTNKDRSDAEACNYYKKLSKLGLDIIYQESDFDVKFDKKHEVRTEPLAAETDVQIDSTQVPKTPKDQMSDNLADNENSNEASGEDTVATTDDEDTGDNTSVDLTPINSEDLSVDKSAIRSMSSDELSEYLEMNFSRDQIKILISDLGLDISVGRKGVPTLIGEIVTAADTDALINYLCK